MFPVYAELFGFVVVVVSHCFYLYSTFKWNCNVKTDSKAEEFNEGMAAGSGTKLTPEEEEAKLRYGPCERCGKEKDHATKNCPLKTIWI
ncbi:hypothetical protein DVH24_017808 [Malus domestica]|uniref:Uncharacterized protein n=1 Tax=Malus domestica TaxID=3750 RepID=A0A498KEF3_MALDO|nr:hypothetical protein DVH24_017808 [Malus domestica]